MAYTLVALKEKILEMYPEIEKKAKDVMTRPVLSARKNASARDIALQLLSGLFSGMPVTDEEGRIIGICCILTNRGCQNER